MNQVRKKTGAPVSFTKRLAGACHLHLCLGLQSQLNPTKSEIYLDLIKIRI